MWHPSRLQFTFNLGSGLSAAITSTVSLYELANYGNRGHRRHRMTPISRRRTADARDATDGVATSLSRHLARFDPLPYSPFTFSTCCSSSPQSCDVFDANWVVRLQKVSDKLTWVRAAVKRKFKRQTMNVYFQSRFVESSRKKQVRKSTSRSLQGNSSKE